MSFDSNEGFVEPKELGVVMERLDIYIYIYIYSAGHLVSLNNDRTLKKIFDTKPDGARSVERPKLRWEDGVDQDMRILGVKNWKKSL